MDDRGDVKIGDLGVAKLLGNAKFASTVTGTPFYMSPELCQGQLYNDKSDVWALGCILYEMCTFKPPFMALHPLKLMKRIVSGKPAQMKGYSEALRAVVNACLLKNPIARKSVRQLLLDEHLSQMATQLGFSLPELRSASPLSLKRKCAKE